ncbi:MAG: phage holin family protein [Bacteroidales bacterium]
MEIKEFTQPVSDIGDSAKEYVNIKIDEFKLKTTKQLSSAVNIIFAWILIAFVAIFTLSFLAVALGLWVGELLSSQVYGFLIVGGVFLLVTIVLIICRKKLFINAMVRTFVKILFKNDEDEEDL